MLKPIACTLIFALLVVGAAVAQRATEKPNNEQMTGRDIGRFQLHTVNFGSIGLYRIDTTSGRTWVLALNADGSTLWVEVPEKKWPLASK